MADGPSEQEQAALEILLHDTHRERIQFSPGRLGDAEVVFVVYAPEATATTGPGSQRIFPLAVLLDEDHLRYVDLSRSSLRASVMLAAVEAARATARAQAEALEAEVARVEELILALEAARRAQRGRRR